MVRYSKPNLSIERNSEHEGQYDRGLLSILDLFGNANDLIEEFNRTEQERLQNEIEASEGSRMLEKVDELEDENEETHTVQRRGYSRDSRKHRDYESDTLPKRKINKRMSSVNRGGSDSENMAVVPYLQQKPKNRIERKAFRDLDKIRKQREEANKLKDMEQEKKKVLEEKRKRKLK